MAIYLTKIFYRSFLSRKNSEIIKYTLDEDTGIIFGYE